MRRDRWLSTDDENVLRDDASGKAVLVGSRAQNGGARELDRLVIAHVGCTGHAAVERVADVRTWLGFRQRHLDRLVVATAGRRDPRWIENGAPRQTHDPLP